MQKTTKYIMKKLNRSDSTFLVLIIISGFMFFMTSCYYDSVEELDPNFGQIGNCDTTGTISFSQRVKPIITTSCGSTGGQAASCHGNSGASGIPLVSHLDISIAASSNLMNAIRHTGGASPISVRPLALSRAARSVAEPAGDENSARIKRASRSGAGASPIGRYRDLSENCCSWGPSELTLQSYARVAE